MQLVKCNEQLHERACGLLQLRHSYDMAEMYGLNYGYRSSLNALMVRHLCAKTMRLRDFLELQAGDLVIDIGSNDGTLLKSYADLDLTLVGVDPTAVKFRQLYPEHITLLPDFFSASLVQDRFPNRKAKVITSIAMFYDLENPLEFVRQIESALDSEGVWLFEQSYMPTMLELNAYDTVCQEHLEYYGLKQIKWLTDKAGLKIIDVSLNAANGGSISVTAAKRDSSYDECAGSIGDLLRQEEEKALHTLDPYVKFERDIRRSRDSLREFLRTAASEGRKVAGYGASTKGNVILQFCQITARDIPFIAEVNPDKFGCYTPGTYIPIVSEAAARQQNPDYFLVFPWHFKDGVIEREKAFIDRGGTLVFPLPELEFVSR
jgi:hypothetical protein